MSAGIFLIVLAAAALHALWNAAVKGGSDKLLGMLAVVLGQGICGAAVLPFVPVPAAESLPWIALGVALHLGYQTFLLLSYRIGDLTQVYPIARGTAPLIVAGVSIGLLGVELSALEITAVLVIGAGIMSLCLVQQADGIRNMRAAALALVTGCFIAAYSLADGTGARLAGTAVGFFGWLAVVDAVIFTAGIAVWRPAVLRRLPGALRLILLGGGASFTAYALVVYAFTPGTDRAGHRVAGDEHHLRAADRRAVPEGAARPDQARLDRDHALRCGAPAVVQGMSCAGQQPEGAG